MERKVPTSKYWTSEELHLWNVEHMLRAGDDGIPNIRSCDNAKVEKIRMKAIMSSFITECAAADDIEVVIHSHYGDEGVRNYRRNKTLIDFECIPDDLQEEILSKYEDAKPSGMRRQKFLSYLIKHKMASLVEVVGDF